MIKDLVITNIPKDEGSLKRVLHKLGDHSWHKEAIKHFVDTDIIHSIWYCENFDSYLIGNDPTATLKYKYIKFDDFVSER